MTHHTHHIHHTRRPGRLVRAGQALTLAVAERVALLRSRPDAGAETAEIVVGIALAAGAAIAVWRFLRPALVDIVSSALSSL